MMWHNLRLEILRGIALSNPHLTEFLNGQIQEMERLLDFAASAVVVRTANKLKWLHIDSEPTLLKEGDMLEVLGLDKIATFKHVSRD